MRILFGKLNIANATEDMTDEIGARKGRLYYKGSKITPVAKTGEMTQAVGVGTDGKLYTKAGGGKLYEHTVKVAQIIGFDYVYVTIISTSNVAFTYDALTAYLGVNKLHQATGCAGGKGIATDIKWTGTKLTSNIATETSPTTNDWSGKAYVTVTDEIREIT